VFDEVLSFAITANVSHTRVVFCSFNFDQLYPIVETVIQSNHFYTCVIVSVYIATWAVVSLNGPHA